MSDSARPPGCAIRAWSSLRCATLRCSRTDRAAFSGQNSARVFDRGIFD